MFSRDDVAGFINQNFEPAWESVRPVPIVTIDFGNGTVVTRTLHGNIATYVCTPDGQVIDILPGAYEPATYLGGLNQLHSLAQNIQKLGPSDREKSLAEYHKSWTRTTTIVPNSRTAPSKADRGKEDIEGGLKKGLSIHHENAPTNERTYAAPPRGTHEELANWKLLAEDTRLNEIIRRRQIHSRLASGPLVRPGEVLTWLYKEVLLADLDDPYLGLKSILFDSYPFQDGPIQ